MKKQYRWKFLREGMKSNSGNCTWKIGKQKTFKGDLVLCESGFHCSQTIYQAFSYVQGEILAKVEVSGNNKTQDDKEVWEKMKIVKAYKWQKKDSVELSIYAAELVIDIYEKQYPNDDRPRKAIEAAKKYIKNQTEKNRIAAGAAAWAAWAAEAARAAAWAAEAARAAGAAEAAWAAEAAEAARAAEAAWAARAAEAAWAAGAAGAAARAAAIRKISEWMEDRVDSLEETI